jgi:hypothetical protein
MLAEGHRASDEAHAAYWAMHPEQTPTSTIPRPTPDSGPYNEARYNSEFGSPPMVNNSEGARVPLQIGTPPRAPTEAELDNPFSISNPEERARVLDYSSRRAAARADIIDRQVRDAQEFSELTNRENWRPEDARALIERRRAAEEAQAQVYATTPPNERGECFPDLARYDTDDSPRSAAVRQYYAARHAEDVARLQGASHAHTPPADITRALAERDRQYGSATSDPPGGLLGARSRATDEASRTSTETALRDSRRIANENTPPRQWQRPQHETYNEDEQEVQGPGFFRQIAINAGKLETWQKVASQFETALPNVMSSWADSLINSFTQIAGRNIQEFDSLFADMRQELARADAMTSSDWARTLAAMERVLKSMNR